MPKPYLIIAAGCNGAGKSTFSKDYVENTIPFDFDKRFLEIYSSIPDSELRFDNGEFDVEYYSKSIPEYAKRRFPEIYKILKDNPPKKSLLSFIFG